MQQLGITRDRTRLEKLTRVGADKGIAIIPLPLISIHELSFVWPVSEDNRKCDWFIFSSAHAVKSFFSGLKAEERAMVKSAHCAVVGEKTCAELNQFGIKADFIASQSYGETLFEELVADKIQPGECACYPRARETNFDPKDLFESHQIDYQPVVCYETRSQTVPSDLINAFTGNDSILFTAPSAVVFYHEQFGRPTVRTVAIGGTTASEMERHEWKVGITMSKPDVDAIWEYI